MPVDVARIAVSVGSSSVAPLTRSLAVSIRNTLDGPAGRLAGGVCHGVTTNTALPSADMQTSSAPPGSSTVATVSRARRSSTERTGASLCETYPFEPSGEIASQCALGAGVAIAPTSARVRGSTITTPLPASLASTEA